MRHFFIRYCLNSKDMKLPSWPAFHSHIDVSRTWWTCSFIALFLILPRKMNEVNWIELAVVKPRNSSIYRSVAVICSAFYSCNVILTSNKLEDIVVNCSDDRWPKVKEAGPNYHTWQTEADLFVEGTDCKPLQGNNTKIYICKFPSRWAFVKNES